LKSSPALLYSQKFAERIKVGNFDDDLAKIKTPTLFIFGKNDALIPNKYLHPLLSIDELTKSAKASINNSKLVVIEEVGHFLQFEKPAETNKAILEFLSCK
jgi:pimeloyl-ACP methyl ester carboxylesterase